MKVVLNIPNVFYEEKECNYFMECLEYYTMYLVKYGKQLGICYGENYSKEFPIVGEYKNECEKGYVEIIK